MHRVILFALFVLPPAIQAQTQPDVAEILKKVSEVYKAASQYELVADATLHVEGSGAIKASHLVLAFKGPNRYRMQGKIPGMGDGNSDFDEALAVHDGLPLSSTNPSPMNSSSSNRLPARASWRCSRSCSGRARLLAL
jgi:hypothetical protein